ncbi:MAG: DUF2341 domain-containing protein [Candidatus Kariarchaeaceae archaeon]
MILATANPASAAVQFTDNNVDSDSNIDSVANIGDDGSTSYLDAQSLNGADQIIDEVDTNSAVNPTLNMHYYKEIVLDSSQIPEDQTNFPVLIYLQDPDLDTDVQADGDDIIFMDSDGNQLSHQIELFDQSFNSTHAELVAWVKTNISSTVDTTITMHYGNPEMTSQQNPGDVWGDYSAVYHFSESSGTVFDSTNSNINLARTGTPSTGTVLDSLGNGMDFQGSNDYLSSGGNSDLARGSSFTWETWIDADIITWGTLLNIEDSGTTEYIDLTLAPDTNAEIQVWDRNDNFLFQSDIDTNTVYHVAYTWDGTTSILYLNGVQVDTDPFDPISMDGQILIGTYNWGTDDYNGRQDEVRFTTGSTRSTNWLLTSYRSISSPDTFFTISEKKVLGAVTVEETVVKGSPDPAVSATLVSPVITGVANDLYLTVISSKGYEDTTTVTGLGLTWTELIDQPAGRSATGISVWWAQGSATTGTVSAVMSAVPSSSMAMQVHRFSNVDPSDPIGTYLASNTNGIGGSGTGGTDDAFPTLDITTTSRNSMMFGASAIRMRTMTPGIGYTEIAFNTAGSSGGTTGIVTQYKTVVAPESITISVDGTLTSDTDWAVAGIEILATRFHSVNHTSNVDPSDWKYYKNLYVDNGSVAGDLDNFPVLVNITDSELKIYAQSDGDDIAFFDISGNQLPHELILYDPYYSGSEAQLTAWVQVDLSGSTDTEIIMRYGNSTIGPQQNPTGVWGANYEGVWHLKEDPSGSAPQFLDSTLSNNGTSAGSMTSTDQIDGKIGGSIDLDGVDDYVSVGGRNGQVPQAQISFSNKDQQESIRDFM